MADKQLPPLPPSDKNSLISNHYDHFYQRSSKSFWRDSQIEYIDLREKPMQKCEHNFITTDADFICEKCKFGIPMGSGLRVQDGKLLYRNQPISYGD